MSINQVNLGARIVSDISLRNTTKKDVPVADFRVCHKNKRLAQPVYMDIEVWAGEAMRAYENLKKGDMVVIIGELRRDVWISKKTGEQRSKTKITASRVVLTESYKPKIENEIEVEEVEIKDE